MPPNLISTNIVCAYSIDQKNTLEYSWASDTDKCHSWQSKSFSQLKYSCIYCLECCVEIWSMELLRMQFWHSKFRRRNEFLKSIFRLWWVRTKQTQQVTVRAHTESNGPLVSAPSSLGFASMEFFQTKFKMQGGLWEVSHGPSQVCLPLVEMALACVLLQTKPWLGLLMADGERGLWVRGEVGATSSASFTSHICDRMKPAGHGLLFHGLENTSWIEQLVSVVRGVRPWHRKGHTREDSSQEMCAITRDHLQWNVVIKRDKTHTNPTQSSSAARDVLLCLESTNISV